MAFSDSDLESVPGFKVSIAWPRLSFLELVFVGQVAVGVSAFPVISHLRALKSSPQVVGDVDGRHALAEILDEASPWLEVGVAPGAVALEPWPRCA
jgi:hypothetical protein